MSEHVEIDINERYGHGHHHHHSDHSGSSAWYVVAIIIVIFLVIALIVAAFQSWNNKNKNCSHHRPLNDDADFGF